MFKAFWQLVKYGVIGVLSTIVQTGVFYALACSCLRCLAASDVAVAKLGFPMAEVDDSVRAWRFAAATAIGFVVANIFCWLMNRRFVFRPGKFRWYEEFLYFFLAAAAATLIAIALSSFLIGVFGLMTTLAVFFEVGVSFVINYFTRKFFIFRG